MLTITFDKKSEDLTTLSQLSSIASGLRKCKKCVVVTGAGVSVSAGIPVICLFEQQRVKERN